MWLGGAEIAAASAEVPTSTIVAGLIALASAALAAWLGARGTLRTADTAREAAFEARVDARLAKAEADLEVMTADRNRYRELYVELRIAVIAAGYDPDDMVSKGAPGGAT